MKGISTLHLRRFLLVGLVLLTLVISKILKAEDFKLLKQQTCSDEVSYTIGEQYIDQGNGVPDNQWSMLTRWQGIKSHQSFIYCDGGEININTWQFPHRDVFGGGYNDMYGYSWSI